MLAAFITTVVAVVVVVLSSLFLFSEEISAYLNAKTEELTAMTEILGKEKDDAQTILGWYIAAGWTMSSEDTDEAEQSQRLVYGGDIGDMPNQSAAFMLKCICRLFKQVLRKDGEYA